MNTEDLKNRQIQAEASRNPSPTGNALSDAGKAKEDGWFAQRDRELIEQMKNKDAAGCGSDCKCDSACQKTCTGKGNCKKDGCKTGK